MFSRFGGMSTVRMKDEIARGKSIRALLDQPRFALLRTVDQVALLAALDAGALDALAAPQILRLREALPARLDRDAPAAIAACDGGGPLDDRMRQELVALVSTLARDLGATTEATP
jgi:F-type H+-transporting ATPase subunit alpha